MSSEKYEKIARLMTSYNFEIKGLSDNLKCVKCKLVLKNACQVPCGCRYCRVCIDDLMANGSEFCLGDSDYCEETLLTTTSVDYSANKSVSKLTVKCPHNGCHHQCPLAGMEGHLRECQKKSVECPFRELGCTKGNLTAEEIDGHLQLDNRRHSEILIGMIANINREMEASRSEIEMLKRELTIKDGTIKEINDQLIHVQNENRSIKNDLITIEQEKSDLADRVAILSAKIEKEIHERHMSDELNSARAIEHVDREVTAIRELIESNIHELSTEMTSSGNVIRSINQFTQLINDDIHSTKSQIQSIQAVVGLAKVDVRYEWVINEDVRKASWWWGDKMSQLFKGGTYPYNYRLVSGNIGNTCDGVLQIDLQIHVGPVDGQLKWPFEGRIVITVTDKGRRRASRSVSRQCKIDRPQDHIYSCSDSFEFSHLDLIGAGLNLNQGVNISCIVVPNVNQ